jgi:hypothetical protein
MLLLPLFKRYIKLEVKDQPFSQHSNGQDACFQASHISICLRLRLGAHVVHQWDWKRLCHCLHDISLNQYETYFLIPEKRRPWLMMISPVS